MHLGNKILLLEKKDYSQIVLHYHPITTDHICEFVDFYDNYFKNHINKQIMIK